MIVAQLAGHAFLYGKHRMLMNATYFSNIWHKWGLLVCHTTWCEKDKALGINSTITTKTAKSSFKVHEKYIAWNRHSCRFFTLLVYFMYFLFRGSSNYFKLIQATGGEKVHKVHSVSLKQHGDWVFPVYFFWKNCILIHQSTPAGSETASYFTFAGRDSHSSNRSPCALS